MRVPCISTKSNPKMAVRPLRQSSRLLSPQILSILSSTQSYLARILVVACVDSLRLNDRRIPPLESRFPCEKGAVLLFS